MSSSGRPPKRSRHDDAGSSISNGGNLPSDGVLDPRTSKESYFQLPEFTEGLELVNLFPISKARFEEKLMANTINGDPSGVETQSGCHNLL